MSKAYVDVSQSLEYPLIIEKDVMIPLRDGTSICADVYRPDVGRERIPVIMNICPYQKTKFGSRWRMSRKNLIPT